MSNTRGMGYVLVCIELVGLYLISRAVIQSLYRLIVSLFRNKSIAISLVTALLFPGTVIHELSHLFTAEVVGVKTGTLTLVPESIEGQEVTTGSITIAKTNPFKRYLIGIAPLVTGLTALCALSWWMQDLFPKISQTVSQDGFAIQKHLLLFIFASYLTFAISNTMFASRQDLKDFFPFAVSIGLIIAAMYISGIRVTLTGSVLAIAEGISKWLTQSLAGVLVLNVILLILTKAGIFILRKLKGSP